MVQNVEIDKFALKKQKNNLYKITRMDEKDQTNFICHCNGHQQNGDNYTCKYKQQSAISIVLSSMPFDIGYIFIVYHGPKRY